MKINVQLCMLAYVSSANASGGGRSLIALAFISKGSNTFRLCNFYFTANIQKKINIEIGHVCGQRKVKRVVPAVNPSFCYSFLFICMLCVCSSIIRLNQSTCFYGLTHSGRDQRPARDSSKGKEKRIKKEEMEQGTNEMVI